MKVIIIGAGIAGLTFALACERSGIEVKIYEKAKALQNIGGGILLWPHGIRYLEWLGLSECLKPFYVDINKCNIFNNDGHKIFSEGYATFHDLVGGKILPIDRSLFQQTLLKQLSPSVLELGKACVRAVGDESEAYVEFSDGTREKADLIVGADGIHSAVRKSFNETANLQYTNHCWWGGIVDQKQVPSLQPDEVFAALGLGKMLIVWPTIGERFMWYLPIKMLLDEFQQENSDAKLQEICAGWNKTAEEIIAAKPLARSFYVPIHTLPPQTNWSTNRMVLIGDAAHTLGPILGQGASQAIEDGFVLIRCLQHNKDSIPQMLKRYEYLRRTKYQRLFELENQAAELMINDNDQALEEFQRQIAQIDLATMYQDLIPLVNEKASLELASAIELVNSGMMNH